MGHVMGFLDRDESLRLKQNGMEQAAINRPELLRTARTIARQIAGDRGYVTADDVAKELIARNKPKLGPAAGSLFKPKEFEWTGLRVVSAQTTNRGRELKVWKLKPSQSSRITRPEDDE